MPPGLYLAVLMAFFPLAVYLPTHLVLRGVFRGGDGDAGVPSGAGSGH